MSRGKVACTATWESEVLPGHTHDCVGHRGEVSDEPHLCSACGRLWFKADA